MSPSSNFEETAIRHLGAAFNLARWLTRDATDAEDVVQESYLRAFRSFDGFRGGDGRAWVLKIVRNTCYTWLQKNRPAQLGGDLDEELYEAPTENPEEQLVRADNRQLMARLLHELPVAYREVVVLRDIEGLSYREIADLVEVPLGTVMSRLARGRKRLGISYIRGDLT